LIEKITQRGISGHPPDAGQTAAGLASIRADV